MRKYPTFILLVLLLVNAFSGNPSRAFRGDESPYYRTLSCAVSSSDLVIPHLQLDLLPPPNGAMNGTPRLRSAYPSTPDSTQKRYGQKIPSVGQGNPHLSLRSPASPPDHGLAPMIPFTVIDAPSQRLYASLFYACLTIWRLSDFFGLVHNDTESLSLFLRWILIDSVFLYGLPVLQIPWLQFSSLTTTFLVVLHILFSAFLMFRIPVRLSSLEITSREDC